MEFYQINRKVTKTIDLGELHIYFNEMPKKFLHM